MPNAKPEAENWETVVDESANRVVFDTIGDVFIGTYVGTIELKGTDDKPFTQYQFRSNDDGSAPGDTLYGINESYKIKQGMENVPVGNLVRIEYIKEVEVGRPQPMRDFRIQHRTVTK